MTTAAPLISVLETVCLVVLLTPVAGLSEYPTSTALVLYVATICTFRYMRDLHATGNMSYHTQAMASLRPYLSVAGAFLNMTSLVLE